MAELGSVVPALFEAVEIIAPPTGLKDRILAAAAADTQRAGAPQVAVTPPAARRRPVVDEPRGLESIFRRPIWAAVSLAAVLAVVALGAWNVQLQDQNLRLQNDVAALAAYRDGVVEVLDVAGTPEAQLAVLTDPSGAAGPSGLAAWGADGTVALVMRDLAPTSGTQVYEAWLIAADGVPIPIGSFRVGADRTATFGTNHVPLGEGVTVALTREPAPGATTPTIPIIVAGVAQSQES
jgi:hypothetical protein